VAEPLTPDAFHESAREFARTALEAHHVQDYRRMALDAGTALEHLVKACLAARSPALLTELRGEANFHSLLCLLGISGQPLRQVRTVGLRDALQRVKSFVVSPASDADLRTLVDLRDGTVHAAVNDEVEERLLAAFARHADALLSDLGRDRSDFWGSQLEVVDALLADASDKVKHRVDVMLAGARARFEQRYGREPPELMELVRQLEPDRELEPRSEVLIPCPVCQTPAALYGTHEFEPDESGPPVVKPIVRFDIDGFSCRICGLRLKSKAELIAAGLWTRLKITTADSVDE
jgi:hypothetical protein